jgi:hypothetical protein
MHSPEYASGPLTHVQSTAHLQRRAADTLPSPPLVWMNDMAVELSTPNVCNVGSYVCTKLVASSIIVVLTIVLSKGFYPVAPKPLTHLPSSKPATRGS